MANYIVNHCQMQLLRFWSACHGLGRLTKKVWLLPVFGRSIECCGAAFVLRPFVHLAAFCRLKRRSADIVVFVFGSSGVRFGKNM